ncbi:MAG: hypothetical protein MRJ96_08290 [Nitrospirales bacterium]|nr:hypothetical protein [Nitrospira sp.]MDR4501431.1 hypothetical protein [Nitrospirales bacterium]
MHTLTPTKTQQSIETVKWHELAPIYPYQVKGSGYLSCVECAHFIRLFSVSNDAVRCCDRTNVLASSTNLSTRGRNER